MAWWDCSTSTRGNRSIPSIRMNSESNLEGVTPAAEVFATHNRSCHTLATADMTKALTALGDRGHHIRCLCSAQAACRGSTKNCGKAARAHVGEYSSEPLFPTSSGVGIGHHGAGLVGIGSLKPTTWRATLRKVSLETVLE